MSPSPMATEFVPQLDGPALMLRRWRAANLVRPKATVFLGHSQPTHSGLLGELGRALSAAGCDTFAGDIRGHGNSVDQTHPRGHLPQAGGWQRAIADMRLLLERAFADVPWERRVVVVPNITALLTLEVMKDWPDLARHIVLISPVPNQRAIALFGKTFSQARVRMRPADAPDEQSLHHLYAFLGAHLTERSHPADVLSSDRSVIERVLSDPSGWPVPTPAYWLNIFTGMLSAWSWPKRSAVREGTRCLVLFGGEDAMLRDGGFLPPIKRFLESVGFGEVASARVEGGRSALFLDEERLKISQHILAWVNAAWQPNVEHDQVEISTVASNLLEQMGDGLRSGFLAPDELVELCYNAIDDERRWIEIMYRIMSETEMTDADEAAVQGRINRLMPHWERSFQLNHQVMMNATLGVLLQTVTERLRIGVGILDNQRQLWHNNEAYREALAHLFTGRPSMLADTEAMTASLLADTIAAQGPGEEDMLVMHDNVPVGFVFHPPALRQTSLQRQGPASIFVLRGPGGEDAGPDARQSLLEISYGMTGKEASVALCIARGLDPTETADRLGISPGTVRSHLKRCFQKMSVHSQAELAARIMSGPVGWL